MMPKMRVWDKEEKRMWNVETIYIEDEYIKVNDGSIYGETKKLVRSYELMRSTELKDKSNKEIYEGDIVRVLIKDEEPKIMKDKTYIGVVVYRFGSFDIKISKDTHTGVITEMNLTNHDYTFEVLAKIYENPYLVNDKMN